MMEQGKVPILSPVSPSDFLRIRQLFGEAEKSDSDLSFDLDHPPRHPLILRGLPLGPCLSTWTAEHLMTSVPEEKVVSAHRSLTPELDWISKNFTYQKVTFRQLVKNCVGPSESVGEGGGDTKLIKTDNFNDKSESSGSGEEKCDQSDPDPPGPYFWYLRSLGEDPRGRDVSDLAKTFPNLASELVIPNQLFPPERFFSSVFRISSAGLKLWTHYDVCDNILIQIKGRKRVLLFPPWDADKLYLVGDKSRVIHFEGEGLDLEQFPELRKVTVYEAVLSPGDILYIPSLWFHNITALDFSLSVNVFWKNLDLELYDKKDPYGNKDLIPAQLALKTFDKATAQLKNLPPTYEDFYLRRMIILVQKRLEELKHNEKAETDQSRGSQ